VDTIRPTDPSLTLIHFVSGIPETNTLAGPVL
jgi:hypothetical protein